MYIEKPYYIVYEVLIYWQNLENELKSFYKIGLIKVEREDRKLDYRYRKEIENGCKVFVLNEIIFDNYKETSKLEGQLIRLLKRENGNESKTLKLDRRRNSTFIGDLVEYPHYFAGYTEACRTPKRLDNLIEKLKIHFDRNSNVYYPKSFNEYLINKLKQKKTKQKLN